MVTFLTSSFVEYQSAEEYVPKPLDTSNEFGNNLKKYWPANVHFLVFTSDPTDYDMTDHVTVEMKDAFSLAGFEIEEIRYFDQRTIAHYVSKKQFDQERASVEALREALLWADVLFLAGGHSPTQNAFMKRCRLKELLQDNSLFDGVIIGLSAGSLNAADKVYVMPELEGESIDPNFSRTGEGLGLTDINILPHYQYEKDVMLDGRMLIDEIVWEDSFGRCIYMITDGSYFLIEQGETFFYGEGDILQDGKKRKLQAGLLK